MSTRQYIGARYVPLFAGDWDATQAYEPLTIVNYLNSSYTSRKAVPVGIVPTNNEYWALTGNFNAQVESYRQEVADMQDELEDYISDNNNMKMTIENAEIALLGDSSFARFNNYEVLTKHFKNAHVTNYSTEAAKWEDIAAQIRNISTTPDIVLIWCGANDVPTGFTSDFGGHMGAPDVLDHTVPSVPTTVFEWIKYCLSLIKTLYPSAQIYNTIRATHPNKLRSAWEYYVFFQSAIMREWAVPVIDLQDVINFSTFIPAQNSMFTTSDGVHYTSECYARIMSKVANIIQSGCPTTLGLLDPKYYFAPASVIDTAQSANGYNNKRRIVNWVVRHCNYPRVANTTGFMAGKVWAYSSIQATTTEFQAFISDAGATRILMPNANGEDITTWVLGSDDNIYYWGSLICTRTINPGNTVAWYDMPEGDYILRGSALNTIGLPTAVSSLLAASNCMLRIREAFDPSNLEGVFAKQILIIPGRDANLINGYRTADGTEQKWYNHPGTQITIS